MIFGLLVKILTHEQCSFKLFSSGCVVYYWRTPEFVIINKITTVII